MTSSDNNLWYSKFHKVIKKPDSLTILSATEKGILFGKGQTYGALVQGFPKSVSVFAESVTLCEPDADEGITFGSTEADTVTLSTTKLVSQAESPSAVVSARGKSGKPNDAGGENGRAGTHGKAGHTLNVFVGQAPLGKLAVDFDARGGHGETTEETDQPAGTGGKGGKVSVVVASTWATIFHSLRATIQLLDPKIKSDGSSDSDDDDEYRGPADDIPNAEVFGRISGIIRLTCRLCEQNDPLSKVVLSTLEPLSDPDAGHTWTKVFKGLNAVHEELKHALDQQVRDVKHSATASGGSGGSAGHRGTRGQNGDAGEVHWKVVKSAKAAGPLAFAPLHPLQCQMQLEKAATLFYFGDSNNLYATQRALASLVAKMGAVLDLDDLAVQSLSSKAQQPPTDRLQALANVYQDQRALLGIPPEIQDPVGELRRIGREAYNMLFRLTRTSVDYYGYQDNWAPRQSVKVFQTETESSLKALEKSEKLFLNLTSRLDKVETDEGVRLATINQVTAGREDISKERKNIIRQLEALADRLFSGTLKAELQRRADKVDFALEELSRQTKNSFQVPFQRILESFGNVAKEIKVPSLIMPRKEKVKIKKPGNVKDEENPTKDEENPTKDEENPTKDEENPTKDEENPTKDEENPTKDKENPQGEDDSKDKDDSKGDGKKPTEKEELKFFDFLGLTKKLYEKAGGEITDLIFEGFTTVPSVDGTSISKALVVSQIRSVVGDLKKLGELSRAKVKRDPKTNALEIDEKQDQLLVTSKEQIDKFVKNFVDVAKIGAQAQKAQEALKNYADLLADRNHDKVQYNLGLKVLVATEQAVTGLQNRQTQLENEGFKKDDEDQLSQMAQMAEDIYSWNRSRAMRHISIYRRAIYLATLAKPENEASGNPSDAELILPAAKLSDMYQRLHGNMFDLQEKAGSDASHYPPNFEKDRGKFVDLTPEDLQELLKYGQVRVTLPAPRREPADGDLPEFRGCADVRVHRVRFWLEGIRIRPGTTEASAKISISHEGDSIYYDCRGEPHAFAHDPIHPGWSYGLPLTSNGDSECWRIKESGTIVGEGGQAMAYAAPSPFATWVISLKWIDDNLLDLSKVTRGRFEFFGTSRDFYP